MGGFKISLTTMITPMKIDYRPSRHRVLAYLCPTLLALFIAGGFGLLHATMGQGEIEVSPEATPEVRQVAPSDATAGVDVTIKIEGRNFSPGAYVSFSGPTVRVVSTRRVSATQLEAQVSIAPKAQPGKVSLYVSNPAGSVAEVPFEIRAAVSPPGLVPATTEVPPPPAGAPQVTVVDPARVSIGARATVKITGKNFAHGVKVSFSNPCIRVLELNAPTATELVARIEVTPDAPTGTTGLFVVNPDDSEVEVAFEVVAGGTPTPPAPTAISPGAATGGSTVVRFEVFNLGEAATLLQNPGKAKGTLTLAGGKLKYEEGGAEVFSASAKDVKEVDINSYFGVKTPVFHVILNSAKTFNFAPASLQPADTQSIVDTLRRALR